MNTQAHIFEYDKNSLDFEDAALNVESDAQVITFRNTGWQDIVIQEVIQTGPFNVTT